MKDSLHTSRERRGFVPPLLYLCLFCLITESAPAESLTIEVRGPDDVGLAGIGVFLERLDQDITASANHTAIDILQKDKGFVPYVSLLQAGSTVTFSNLDDITHHIYSVTGNERFSFTLRAGEITPDMTIEQAGLIAMGCNIHDWMSGYLLVVNSPYYGITNSEGTVVIEVQDSGNYRIRTWHPQIEKGGEKLITVPGVARAMLKLEQGMAKIPLQRGVDDFDFLENY